MNSGDIDQRSYRSAPEAHENILDIKSLRTAETKPRRLWSLFKEKSISNDTAKVNPYLHYSECKITHAK